MGHRLKKRVLAAVLALCLTTAVSCAREGEQPSAPISPDEIGVLQTTDTADPFERFMPFPSNRGYFYGKKLLDRNEVRGLPFVLFRVIGIEEEMNDFITYTVRIEEAYGIEHYDTERVYRMGWRGLSSSHLYGRPPLEIGEVYGRFLVMSEEGLQTIGLWQAGLVYGVRELDGKRYLYGYGSDLSRLDCKIPITDPEENSIYKTGKHDKVIAALQSLGQELPVFDYKVELISFYDEING